MLNVIYDPNLYLLLLAAYVVGFVDTEDPASAHVGWNRISDLGFWCSFGLVATLFVTHGLTGGVASLAGAWAASIIGLRRGVLAQRNSLWETALWTMSLEAIVAATGVGAMSQPEPAPASLPARKPVRATIRPARQPARTADRPDRLWQLPALASLLPNRGRRLTIMGIAMDVATCFVVVSALSLLVR
jgi:hypothetical protein